MTESFDYIETQSGTKFHFMDPQPDEILLTDIAYSLARTPRWGAHSDPIISVAEHSINVSQMLMRCGYSYEVQLQGLLHDAAEAYLGDIPTPIKRMLPDFKALELIVEAAIFEKLEVPFPLPAIVKTMDTEAYRWEYRDLMSGGSMCNPPNGTRSPLKPCESPEVIELYFLSLFAELKGLQGSTRLVAAVGR